MQKMGKIGPQIATYNNFRYLSRLYAAYVCRSVCLFIKLHENMFPNKLQYCHKLTQSAQTISWPKYTIYNDFRLSS